MARDEATTHCSRKLQILADKTRLGILRQLIVAPRHVHELNGEVRIGQSLLSHHLRVMRDAGLVRARRDGKAVLYELAPEVRLPDAQAGIDLGCCRLSF